MKKIVLILFVLAFCIPKADAFVLGYGPRSINGEGRRILLPLGKKIVPFFRNRCRGCRR